MLHIYDDSKERLGDVSVLPGHSCPDQLRCNAEIINFKFKINKLQRQVKAYDKLLESLQAYAEDDPELQNNLGKDRLRIKAMGGSDGKK